MSASSSGRAAAFMLGLAVTAGAYFVLAKAGLGLASVHPAASPIWAPSGIALAALLLMGVHAWPAIFAGAFLANLMIVSAPLAAVIAAGNTLEGVVMALLLARFSGGVQTFDRPGRIAGFTGVAFASGTIVGATIGASALCLYGTASWDAFAGIWTT